MKITGGLTFDLEILARFMPMHLVLNNAGVIKSIGPTLAKVLEKKDLIGQKFFNNFAFESSSNIKNLADFDQFLEDRLEVYSKFGESQSYPTMMSRLPENQGYFLNLSVGAKIFEMIDKGLLLASDFAYVDQTIDMIYLIEMQSALLGESSGINQKLKGDKLLAQTQASFDSLTGLPNRRAVCYFIDRLSRRNGDEKFAVVLLDLDFFKEVNDKYGHAGGDQVLKIISQRLQDMTRPLDMVARIGGDEFVLVLPNLTNYDSLRDMCERLIYHIKAPIKWKNHVCEVGASIGAIITDGKGFESVDQILLASDDALYQSKGRGRGCVTLTGEEL